MSCFQRARIQMGWAALLSLFVWGSGSAPGAAPDFIPLKCSQGRLSGPSREALRKVLREALKRERGWVRIHAAEALAHHGFSEEVQRAFTPLCRDAQFPERIGLRRALAAASTGAEQAAQVKPILDALREPAGAYRLHAAESLAKLGWKLSNKDRAALRESIQTAAPEDRPFFYWALAPQGSKEIHLALGDSLAAKEPLVRLRSAYVLGRTRPLPDSVLSKLADAASKEELNSIARVYLISAALASAKDKDPQSFEHFKALLRPYAENGSRAEKSEVCWASFATGSSPDQPLLFTLANDAESDVRIAAANALLRLERRAPFSMDGWAWLVIGLYFAGMIGVGWFYARRNKTEEDYLLGGRTMKPWAVGLSLFATLLSTISYLSKPGEIIRHGPMILAGVVAFPFIAVVVGWILIPVIMRLRITSAYEVLEKRLGFSIRMLGSVFFLCLRLLWMAVIVHATTDKVLIPLLGWPAESAVYLSAGICLITMIYTSLGGLRAVVFTDVLQTLVLFGGAFAATILITYDLGGVQAWWPSQWASSWEPIKWGYDPDARVTFLSAFVATFFWFVCTAGSDQMAIQRYLAVRDPGSARRMFIYSLLANALVWLFLAALGFALLAWFQQHPEFLADGHTVATQADQLFPRFIVLGLPSVAAGLVTAGLLAAAMSSLSSGMNSACSVITVDFLDRLRTRRAQSTQGLVTIRWISFGVGVAVVLLGAVVGTIKGNLLELAFKVVNLLVAPLFGLFFMALFVPWARSLGTWIGALTGLALVVAINYWEDFTGAPGISFLWAMPLGLTVQISVGALVDLLPLLWARIRGNSNVFIPERLPPEAERNASMPSGKLIPRK